MLNVFVPVQQPFLQNILDCVCCYAIHNKYLFCSLLLGFFNSFILCNKRNERQRDRETETGRVRVRVRQTDRQNNIFFHGQYRLYLEADLSILYYIILY